MVYSFAKKRRIVIRMFKRKKFLLLITLITFLLTLAACGSSSSPSSSNSDRDEPIEMVVNSWFASGEDVPENVWEPWKEYVEEKTDGRVKVTIHYNGALAGSNEILEGVRSGTFDVGMALAMYYEDSSLFPLTIGDLPFAHDADPEKDAAIIQQFAEEYEEEIWSDVINVGVGATPPRYLYSTNPIDSIDFLKGKNARVSNDSEAVLFQNMGATPTEVAFEETYNALDKGLIEATISSHDVYTNLQLVDPAPYFVNNPIGFTQGTAIMNKDFFNSLPEDLQQLFIEDINPKWEELFEENAKKVMAKDSEVIKMAEENGGKVTTFEGKELEEFQSYGKPVWEDWVRKAIEKGYPGEEMMERFIEISKEHGVDLDFLE